MKEKLEQIKGITLIALVITIIVLLILAGVSIAMLTGENGILSQAQKAKEETENAQLEEENKLVGYEDFINNATGDVPQVNDSNPGTLEGNGTEKEPYTINSIEDLVSFADSVTNGNTYEGQYVKLNQSLDFKSDKSYVDPNRENYYGYAGKLKEALTTGEGFKPIGTTIRKENLEEVTNSFYGIFDGNGKQIINCYMNKEIFDLEQTYRFSFFGSTTLGVIKNLGLTKVDFNLLSNQHESGISGVSNISYGQIVNCYVTGSITATQEGDGDIYCTGITVSNLGTIENCYNLANINLIVTQSAIKVAYCAGIVSNNEHETSIIRNCYNAGNITANINCQNIQIGGIVRYNNKGTVENCYNSGNIECKKDTGELGSCRVGGIIGQQAGGIVKNLYNKGSINVSTNNLTTGVGGIVGLIEGTTENCYNIGNINNVMQSPNCSTGELAGDATASAVMSNSFYLNNEPIGENLSSSCVTTKVTNEQLKSDETLDTLNQSELVWKKDTSNINNGYPIFTWQ